MEELTGALAELGAIRSKSHVHRSASYQDVQTVAEDAEAASKRSRTPAPPIAGNTGAAKSKLSSVCRLAEGLMALQEGENDIAEVVVVCEPEQASLMMGGLHPRGSLYERPVNIDTAKAQHAEFRAQVSIVLHVMIATLYVRTGFMHGAMQRIACLDTHSLSASLPHPQSKAQLSPVIPFPSCVVMASKC